MAKYLTKQDEEYVDAIQKLMDFLNYTDDKFILDRVNYLLGYLEKYAKPKGFSERMIKHNRAEDSQYD